MDQTINKNPPGSPLIAASIALVLMGFYLYFFGYRAHVVLEVETPSARPDFFNIYWDDGQGAFSESRKNRVRINDKHQIYSLFIGDLGSISRLRIDPMEYAGELKIKALNISQTGYADIILDSESRLSALVPFHQVENSGYRKGGMWIKTNGPDPQLMLDIEPVDTHFIFPMQHIFSMLGILAFVWTVYRLGGQLFRGQMFVPACLLMILLLVTTMASITGEDVHPDETVHTRAAQYYSEHLLPPPVESRDIQHTFSVYGYSRLTSMEVYYQLAGYFSRIVEPLKLSPLFSVRVFGIAMIAFLFLFALKQPDFRCFLLPFITSAQAWYLFSYANSDSFALFLSLIMAYQVAVRDSTFNRFLTVGDLPWFWLQAAGLGVLCGGLLLIKTNYYFFVLFLGLYLLWRMWCGEFENKKRLWFRIATLVVIGLGVYGVRYGLHVHANGSDNSRIEAMIEAHAHELYKPSTELEEKHAYLFMKERGVSLEEIVAISRWGEKTFITAFGAYGFTQFLATEIFYDLVRYGGGLVLLLLAFGALVRAPPRVHWIMGFGVACAVALIAAAFWHSWTVSFQPQGRYMMAIIPMLGVIYHELKAYAPTNIITALVFGLFLLGLYSFIFIGLHDVPKFDYVL